MFNLDSKGLNCLGIESQVFRPNMTTFDIFFDGVQLMTSPLSEYMTLIKVKFLKKFMSPRMLPAGQGKSLFSPSWPFGPTAATQVNCTIYGQLPPGRSI